MQTARLFQNGKSQAVRLPKEFRFNGDRVYVKRIGNAIILLPYGNGWESLVDSLSMFSDDYMLDRRQPPIQDRENVFA
ncbi:MAG: type II toxin-antitoxin system VapB family antitoxin [Chloroflexota bacterium]|jgi:antitoxin VapB